MVGIAFAKMSSLFLTIFGSKKNISEMLPENNGIEDSPILPMHQQNIKTNNELFENLKETGEKLDNVSWETLNDYIDKRVSKILKTKERIEK